MTSGAFEYFILRCLALGMKPRTIASVLNYSESTIRLRIAVVRQRYHVNTTRALMRALLGE